MKVCSGCETEYDEAFKFCPECGREFGKSGTDETARMNAALYALASSAQSENRVEQQLRRNRGSVPGLIPDAQTPRVAAGLLMRDMRLGANDE